LEQVGELGRLKLASSTCSGEERVRFEADIQKCELEIRVLGEQIQACMALVGSLEGGDRGNTTQKEKEEEGDMGLGKSIVLGMAKFSCKIGQDPSAHASEVVQVVNTLSLSDAEKKTAFLATLQGYPLRMMSGMAGNPQFTFADLVAEFLALYGRDDRGAEDALNRAAREDRQEKEESTTIFRDRVHALALGAGKDVDQPAVIRLFLDGLRDEKVRGQAALENLDKLQDWKKAAARVLEIERAVRQVTVMDAIRDMDQKSEEVFAFHAKAGAVPQDQGARGRDEGVMLSVPQASASSAPIASSSMMGRAGKSYRRGGAARCPSGGRTASSSWPVCVSVETRASSTMTSRRRVTSRKMSRGPGCSCR
jgi:hypothetical protein